MSLKLYEGTHRIVKKVEAGALAMLMLFSSAFAEEKNVEVTPTTSVVALAGQQNNSANRFYIGYPEYATKTHELKKETIAQRLEEKGATISYDEKNKITDYILNVEGQDYKYRSRTGQFMSDNGRIKCRFFATDDNLDNIKTVMVIIGGTSSRGSGEDFSDVALNPGTLIVSCYTGDLKVDTIATADVIADCTKFVNAAFGGDKVYNVIGGTSEGSLSAFTIIAKNPGLFQTLICANGSSYRWGRRDMITATAGEEGYKSFNGMEVIFLQSMNNRTGEVDWNEIAIRTIEDLKRHGIENISFFTSDPPLSKVNSETGETRVESLVGKENFHYLNAEESKANGRWGCHGDGIKMIKKSNVLSYVSSDAHTIAHEVDNGYVVSSQKTQIQARKQ